MTRQQKTIAAFHGGAVPVEMFRNEPGHFLSCRFRAGFRDPTSVNLKVFVTFAWTYPP